MRVISTVPVAMAASWAMVAAAHAEPKVVASIKPIHGLVAAVMGGTGSPELLVDGASSPHNYALRPSQAANLQDADIVFWVGEPLERFLDKALETIGAYAQSVALSEIDGLKTLGFRDIEVAQDDHDNHEGHDHGDHDDHAKKDDHEHDHDHGEEKHADHDDHGHDDHEKEEKHAGHDHDAHAGHDHGEGSIDPHIWLDTDNARLMVTHIAEVLAAADADNADSYKQNAAALISQLDTLNTEIETQLAPHAAAQFVVFHDAYHYFEDRFGLQASAAITVSPETPPGAQRVREIQDLLVDRNVSCIFDEPQFEPRIITTIIGDKDINRATLDPLGVDIPAGPDFYPALIRSLSTSFAQCFAPAQ